MNQASSNAKTSLVTGGSDGIGKAIARALAMRGDEVFIVGRDPDKGRLTVEEVRAASRHDRVHFLQADLSLVRDTDRLASGITGRIPHLDRLVLCAGIVRGRQTLTEEGIESNFATNYLSRFVLTERLLGLLQAAGSPGAAARIVVIGGAAMNGRIYYEDVNLTKNFGILRMVRQFCQANDLFVIEQARRLEAAGLSRTVTVNTLKVGVVRTGIRREFPGWMRVMVPLVFDPLLAQTPEQIAASALPLLTDPAYEGTIGRLFIHIKRFKAVEPSARTRDPDTGRRFWKFSERLAARARGRSCPPYPAGTVQGMLEARRQNIAAADVR